MSISYRLVQRRDMSKGAGPDDKLYYAQSVSNGSVDFNTVCENIAKISTASTGDVKVVLDGLIYEIKRAMKSGQIVQIVGLGSFQAIVSSSGSTTQEDFQASQVKTPKIVFRASKDLRQTAMNLTFNKIDLATETPEGGEDDEEIEDGPVVQ